MTLEKETLSLALDSVATSPGRLSPHEETLFAAASMLEKLLPGKCEAKRCKGKYGHQLDQPCRMTGKVWDKGLIEAIQEAVSFTEAAAIEVLQAIVDTLTDTKLSESESFKA